jgi:hypothetical protein
MKPLLSGIILIAAVAILTLLWGIRFGIFPL